MPELDQVGSDIRFTQTWRPEGETKDILDELKSYRERLPSTSQWYRLRQNIMAAKDINHMERFLDERQEKASSRKNWCFKFKEKPFHEFLAETFLRKVEGANNINELLGYKYFGLEIVGLPDHAPSDFSRLRLLVAQQALLRFIDEVILLKEGITYSIIHEQGTGRVEVQL